MKIAILGGGSWGLALATHLVKRNEIKMWEFFPDKALEMNINRKSPYLTDADIPQGIEINSNLESVIEFGDVILVVVPSDKVAATLEKCAEIIKYKPLVLCSKGFTVDGRLLSQVAEQYTQGEIYCLYGPTIADEVYKFQFTGVVLAGRTKNEALKKVLEDEDLKVELSDDVIGVQIAASLKNVLAIYVGMLEGMGLGENAKSYVITKGLQEIMEFGYILGAKRETFYSIAGIGDIITTCFSEKSRNRTFGEAIGRGKTMEQVLADMTNVVEGLSALKIANQIADVKNIDMPLIKGLYHVVYENADPLELLHSLD